MVNDFKKTDFLSNVISKDLGLNMVQVKNTVVLLEGGATIPFISRYRKEKTGNFTETQVRLVSEKFDYFTELEKRKDSIFKEIEKQGKLTPELKQKIGLCVDKNELEDIYLPFKPKKRTRATVAREKGLEGLADVIYYQKTMIGSKQDIVSRYVNPQKEVNDYKEALAGALDIVAERISDNDSIRGLVRKNTQVSGFIVSSVKKDFAEKQSKFQNYYDFSELIKKSPSHRLLAMRRGQSEKVLTLKITVDEEDEVALVESKVMKNEGFLFSEELKLAARDSFKRLLFPSIEKEVFNINYEDAEKEAIDVFSKNLANLLLAPPTGGRVIMGLDPGFRTGCKVVVIDSKGTFKEFKAIFPHEPQRRVQEAEQVVLSFVERFGVELIAIGNGTASIESDIFIKNLIKKQKLE
ncbi:MAG: RNA-binding transcriptional accessory protein, partial [Candidatus Diapherotrites archaeon]|nr:RNA-binding transcriptional accessory protein [Candidatus Diapherotrites archaeon]